MGTDSGGGESFALLRRLATGSIITIPGCADLTGVKRIPVSTIAVQNVRRPLRINETLRGRAGSKKRRFASATMTEPT